MKELPLGRWAPVGQNPAPPQAAPERAAPAFVKSDSET
jgi:hypothetical protein